MPVPSSFLWVHGIFLEDGVEHVCAVDLAEEVAVVAGVVASQEMTESSLTVTCGNNVNGFCEGKWKESLPQS